MTKVAVSGTPVELDQPREDEVTTKRRWQTRSFWMDRASCEPAEALEGDTSCDIVIVGGGYTGLWTAIHLKEVDPAIDVVVLEADVVGYGASGRNGGFAMTMIGRGIHDLVKKVGPEDARATHYAMRTSLHEIQDFCAKEEIEADVSAPGLLTLSNGPEQDIRIRQDLEAANRLNLDDYHELSADQCYDLVHTRRARLGHFEEDSLLVDPAALTRGLRDAAIRQGVRVHEQTNVRWLDESSGPYVEAITNRGRIRAERALVATNAYAHAVPELRRYIFTVYAHIIVTEPLSDAQWERVGWDRRMGIEDKRVMPHFHRPTPDGRILWGGRDAPFSHRGPDATVDGRPWVFGRLEETFRWTFPQLADVRIASGWAGPVCGTVNCFATVGWLSKRRRIAYAVGYSGHGVGPTHLAAKILRDMLCDRDSELCQLPMATKRAVHLPPNPFRGLFLDTSQRVLQHSDDVGGHRGPLINLALKILD